MPNPFDDADRPFQVLVNARRQHSLWPVPIPVPDGWTPVHGPASRQSCLDYVEAHWTDIRPAHPGPAAARTGDSASPE